MGCRVPPRAAVQESLRCPVKPHGSGRGCSRRHWVAYVSVGSPAPESPDGLEGSLKLPKTAQGLLAGHWKRAGPFLGHAWSATSQPQPATGSNIAPAQSEVKPAEPKESSGATPRAQSGTTIIPDGTAADAVAAVSPPKTPRRSFLRKRHAVFGASGGQKGPYVLPHNVVDVEENVCELARSCRRQHVPDTAESDLPMMDACMSLTVGRNSVGTPSGEQKSTPKSLHSTSETFRIDAGTLSTAPAARFTAALSVYEAFELAERFNLPRGQVTQAWKIFKRYDASDSGLLSAIEFQLLLRNMLRGRHPNVKDVPRELFDRASDMGSEISFIDFLTWLSVNSFSEHLLLSEEEKSLRQIARKYKVAVPVVEQIKGHFDKFDRDRTGRIEYGEFAQLLRVLLKVKDAASLPDSRVLAFWREIDDGNGVLDFQEFIPWYLSNFDSHAEISPLEEYYRNIRRVPFQWKAFTNN